LDTRAAFKLLAAEEHADAFLAFYREHRATTGSARTCGGSRSAAPWHENCGVSVTSVTIVDLVFS
jgi:hypothetical protein